MAYPKSFQFNLKQFAQAGLQHAETVHYQSSPDELLAQAINNSKAQVKWTKLAKDRSNAFSPMLFNHLVVEADQISNGAAQNNKPTAFATSAGTELQQHLLHHFNQAPQLWVHDFFANSNHTPTIRLVTDSTWCAFFVSQMFGRPDASMLPLAAPDMQLWIGTQLHPPTASEAPAIQATGIIDLKAKTILLSGPCTPVHLQRLVAIALNLKPNT